MYEQAADISVIEGNTVPKPTRRVVYQGCLLSPGLFNARTEMMRTKEMIDANTELK